MCQESIKHLIQTIIIWHPSYPKIVSLQVSGIYGDRAHTFEGLERTRGFSR